MKINIFSTAFLYFLVMMFLLIGCNTQKNNQTDKPKAELTFNRKIVDFGECTDDTLLKTSFPFSNTGTSALIIKYINPDCSCTDYWLSHDTIQPGATGYIELYLSTNNKFGDQKIHAIICTNTEARFYKLTLLASIH